MADILFTVAVLVSVWLLYLWINQPKYEDGRYVPVRTRLCKVLKRAVPCRDKQRADDP